MSDALEFIALANIALIASFAVAWLIEQCLKKTRFRTAFKLRLNLAIAALVATCLPFVLAPVKHALSATFDVNVTDIVVAQYLKGNIGISATQLTDAIDAKNHLVQDLVGAGSWLSIAVLSAFLIGAGLRLAYILLNVVRVRRIISGAQRIRRSRRVDILLSDRITIPFSTRGLFRYSIVIPDTVLADRQAAAIVLSHEAQHIRQHDVDWEIFLSVISPLFIINPAFLLVSGSIRRFREYSCDAALLTRGRFDAKAYCVLLLQVASSATQARTLRATGEFSTSVPFLGREVFWRRSNHTALRQRVVAISDLSQQPVKALSQRWNWVPAVVLGALMAITVLVMSKPADWSHDRLMLSTVVNLERLDRINGFGVAPLR